MGRVCGPALRASSGTRASPFSWPSSPVSPALLGPPCCPLRPSSAAWVSVPGELCGSCAARVRASGQGCVGRCPAPGGLRGASVHCTSCLHSHLGDVTIGPESSDWCPQKAQRRNRRRRGEPWEGGPRLCCAEPPALWSLPGAGIAPAPVEGVKARPSLPSQCRVPGFQTSGSEAGFC